MDQSPEPAAGRCILEHPVFTMLGSICFRRAGDGAPSMVIAMGEREASVTLRSLQREFAIDEDSPDGRMLELIAASLDYVVGLHLGDLLPREVLTGEASWEPKPAHRALAATKLRLQLLAWLDPEAAAGGTATDTQTVARLDDDPKLRQQVQHAFEQAAEALGLPSAEAVVTLVGRLADELSYMEALRDTLLRRVQALVARLGQMSKRWRGDPQRQETLTQVHRLTVIACRQIGARFDDVDAQTGEVLAALRNAESQQAFIRSNRDWLYRCRRAWDSILKDWDYATMELDEAAWMLIGRTYQFLAPRYMPVTEWQSFESSGRAKPTKKADTAMRW